MDLNRALESAAYLPPSHTTHPPATTSWTASSTKGLSPSAQRPLAFAQWLSRLGKGAPGADALTQPEATASAPFTQGCVRLHRRDT